jgi:hypothetical protein
MIFLRDNAYLKEDLKFEHIKARLLGMVCTISNASMVANTEYCAARPLGNMPRSDARLFASQLSHTTT